LFSKVTGSEKFTDNVNVANFEERRTTCEDFLIDIMFYYMSDYPFSYKNITSRFVDKPLALDLYERTKDYIAWLRSFQPKIEVPKMTL
jgi:hypothetical protein